MIAEQPVLMSRRELDFLFRPYTAATSSPSPSPSPSTSTSQSEDDCDKCSVSSLSTPPSSPSMDCYPQTLFRLLPTCRIPYGIKLGAWITITLELLCEFGGFQYEASTRQKFKLKDGQALLPLDCCLLYEWKGQISSQSPPSHSLVLEKRALQSTNWLGMESLSGPGIGGSSRGGLELRVMPTLEQAPVIFWISISSERDQEIVPLVLGPFTVTKDFCNIDETPQILRSISIPQRGRFSPRTMLLKETWNNVPQGRVWDSAFVLIDIFSKKVADSLCQSTPPIFAGKRILDLSAGTGLLGIFLAGLAQVELETSSAGLSSSLSLPSSSSSSSSSSPSSSPPPSPQPPSPSPPPSPQPPSPSPPPSPQPPSPSPPSSQHTYSIKEPYNSSTPPCTTVMLTDLADALGLMEFNVSSNRHRIASNINIVVKELAWGTPHLAKLDVGELDVVIASDVVYEVDSFEPLLETLCGLCTPGRTTLYLGYKRRHLTESKESYFFDGIKNKFNVIETLHDLDVQVWCLKKRLE